MLRTTLRSLKFRFLDPAFWHDFKISYHSNTPISISSVFGHPYLTLHSLHSRKTTLNLSATLSIGLANPCCLPAESGLCMGAIKKFFYDKVSQDCDEFTYGGCLGNRNNFETKELCLQVCGNVQC